MKRSIEEKQCYSYYKEDLFLRKQIQALIQQTPYVIKIFPGFLLSQNTQIRTEIPMILKRGIHGIQFEQVDSNLFFSFENKYHIDLTLGSSYNLINTKNTTFEQCSQLSQEEVSYDVISTALTTVDQTIGNHKVLMQQVQYVDKKFDLIWEYDFIVDGEIAKVTSFLIYEKKSLQGFEDLLFFK